MSKSIQKTILKAFKQLTDRSLTFSEYCKAEREIAEKQRDMNYDILEQILDTTISEDK